MKYLVVLVALAAIVAAEDTWNPEEFTSSFEEINKSCVKESAMSEEQITKVRNRERPDEKEVHDYVHCCVKKLQIFDDDKGFHSDRLMQAFALLRVDVEKAKEIVTKCVDGSAEKSTPAEKAFHGVDCMMNNKIDDLLKDAQDKLKDEQPNEA